MSKVFLKVEVSVVLDTDLTNVRNIMDSIDIEAIPNDEQVQIVGKEIQNFYLENE